MLSTLQTLKQYFAELNTLLENDDFASLIKDESYVVSLTDVVTELYIMINTGFCEFAEMSSACHENRDQLASLMELLDRCENQNFDCDSLVDKLNEFKLTLPSLMEKLQYVEKAVA